MPPLPSLDDLAAFGVPEEIITGLRARVTSGDAEDDVVLVFLHLLAQSPSGRLLSRQAKRFIHRAFRTLAPPKDLIDAVTVTANTWLNPRKRIRDFLAALRPSP